MTTPLALKKARLDYQTSRDAIVDEVNAIIIEIETETHAELVNCQDKFMRDAALIRKRYLGGEIDGDRLRELIEERREQSGAWRASCITLRLARLSEVNRWGSSALEQAKDVYRAAVGDPSAG